MILNHSSWVCHVNRLQWTVSVQPVQELILKLKLSVSGTNHYIVNKSKLLHFIKGLTVFHVIFGEKQMWHHLTKLPSTSGLPDLSDLHSDSTVTDLHYSLYLEGEGEPECCSDIDDTWICTEKEEDIVMWALKQHFI